MNWQNIKLPYPSKNSMYCFTYYIQMSRGS